MNTRQHKLPHYKGGTKTRPVHIVASFPRIHMVPKSVATLLATLMYRVGHIDGDASYANELTGFVSEDGRYAKGILHPLHWK
ncbi:hypothetical protein H7U32_06355 [Bifidobacterium pullorum subsp. saeculare]|uniref:Uncharacterized protein n=1 Tax=Bifidobacterium pullorum subsp. saeculare TaxID=78257 RepID=A0A939B8I7_9BIFI|nr:hypothetical protein [Bifidobacterium pullorum]MBM6699932.1 hypothetical protein [Bifidobacterium pullorum subsp. saeculare]